MLKKIGIILLLLVSNPLRSQIIDKIKTRGNGDPANPTSLFTRYDSHFDLQFDSKYYQVGNLWSIAYAFNQKHQVAVNTLIAFSSQSNTLGLGDTEIGYSTMPLLDSNAFLSALGFRMEVLLPTGNYDKNLGIGGVRVSPGVIANFKFSNRLFMLPELKYLFTSKVLQDIPDGFANSNHHGFDASFKVVFKPTDDSWIWVTPAFTTFDLANATPEFELEIVYGVKLLNRVGLSAYFNRNFTTNAYNFQFINAIYF